MNNMIITFDDVLLICGLSKQLQRKSIEPFLPIAHMTFRSRLKNVFDDLQTAYLANSMTPVQTQLYDLVRVALAWEVYSTVLPIMVAEMNESGVVRSQDERYTPASGNATATMTEGVRGVAVQTYKYVEDFVKEYSEALGAQCIQTPKNRHFMFL